VALRGKEAVVGANTFVASTVRFCAQRKHSSFLLLPRSQLTLSLSSFPRSSSARSRLHCTGSAPLLAQASLIGDVSLAEGASAWYGATLRADRAAIRVGKGSAVLDNALVSTTAAGPASLGADVTVCAGAHVQSAALGDGAIRGVVRSK
jgi:hypothetical protein